MDVRVNSEETHDDSDKGTVAQAIPNDAPTQKVGAVLATVSVETTLEVKEVFPYIVRVIHTDCSMGRPGMWGYVTSEKHRLLTFVNLLGEG